MSRRKSCLLALLVVLVGLFAVLPRAQAEVKKGKLLFSEDFEGGLDQWLRAGDGQVQNGWYVLAGHKTGTHEPEPKVGEDWTDYILEFDVKILTRQAGWIVRQNPSKGYYLFCLQTTHFTPHLRLDEKMHHEEMVRFDPLLDPGKPHHVRTEVVGSVLKTYIDGE